MRPGALTPRWSELRVVRYNQAVEVHPTAVVDPSATLGDGVCVGPYAVIEDQVIVGPGTTIGPHAVIHRFTRIGADNRIFAHAVLGGLPQDRNFDDAETWVEIGDANVIREGVTVNRATVAGAATTIGSRCMLLAYSHVGHDCRVGDDVVLANNVMLGGHVTIGDRATLGGNAGVHQFVRVGALAMVAGYIAVRRDVLPYCLVAGEPVRHYRLNVIGLRRAGINAAGIDALERAFTAMRRGAGTLEDLGESPEIERLRGFLATPTSRGIYGFVKAARRDL